MSAATESITSQSQRLLVSLDGIFLAIGNAYLEANRIATKENGGMADYHAMPMDDASVQIKKYKSMFLDTLDALEIMVLRATEVLERKAQQTKSAALEYTDLTLDDDFQAATQEAAAATTANGVFGEQGDEKGQDIDRPFVLTMDTPQMDSIVGAVDGITTEVSQVNDTPDLATEIPATGATTAGDGVLDISQTDASALQEAPSLVPAVPISAGKVSDEDELTGLDQSINFNFGDMDFEHFNFDDTTHFDFGSMIED